MQVQEKQKENDGQKKDGHLYPCGRAADKGARPLFTCPCRSLEVLPDVLVYNLVVEDHFASLDQSAELTRAAVC